MPMPPAPSRRIRRYRPSVIPRSASVDSPVIARPWSIRLHAAHRRLQLARAIEVRLRRRLVLLDHAEPVDVVAPGVEAAERVAATAPRLVQLEPALGVGLDAVPVGDEVAEVGARLGRVVGLARLVVERDRARVIAVDDLAGLERDAGGEATLDVAGGTRLIEVRERLRAVDGHALIAHVQVAGPGAAAGVAEVARLAAVRQRGLLVGGDALREHV